MIKKRLPPANRTLADKRVGVWCKNCEKLGVKDSSNVYIMCNECMNWKIPLQEKPGE